jgi:hypothetical protein
MTQKAKKNPPSPSKQTDKEEGLDLGPALKRKSPTKDSPKAQKRKSKAAASLKGLDPRKPFYISLMASWDDGSLDPNEAVEHMGAMEDCSKALAGAALEHGCVGYLYLCTPICRIGREVTYKEIEPDMDLTDGLD